MSTNHQVFAGQSDGFSSLPVSAKNLGTFIPKGWYLEHKIDAKLNEDSFTDSILILTDRDKGKNNTEGNRKLLILLGAAEQSYILNSIGHNLLWCEECYGTLGGPGGNNPEIKVKKGVISIYQSGGSTLAVDITLKFRYEPTSNKFRLVGKDTILRDRPSGNAETTSINYLTNLKMIGNTNFDRFGLNEKNTDRSEQISSTVIYLDSYNIDDL